MFDVPTTMPVPGDPAPYPKMDTLKLLKRQPTSLDISDQRDQTSGQHETTSSAVIASAPGDSGTNIFPQRTGNGGTTQARRRMREAEMGLVEEVEDVGRFSRSLENDRTEPLPTAKPRLNRSATVEDFPLE